MPTSCLFIFNGADAHDLGLKERLLSLGISRLQLFDVNIKEIHAAILATTELKITHVPAFVAVTDAGFRVYYAVEQVVNQFQQRRAAAMEGNAEKPLDPLGQRPVPKSLKYTEAITWGKPPAADAPPQTNAENPFGREMVTSAFLDNLVENLPREEAPRGPPFI